MATSIPQAKRMVMGLAKVKLQDGVTAVVSASRVHLQLRKTRRNAHKVSARRCVVRSHSVPALVAFPSIDHFRLGRPIGTFSYPFTVVDVSIL